MADTTCEDCGQEFDTYQGLNSHRGHMHDTGEVVECAVCGDEFEVTESKASFRKTCSHECRAKRQSEEFSGEGGPGWEGGKEMYECRWCGSEFEQWPNQNGTDFCDHGCYAQWLRENAPSGEEHHSYIDGEGAYGSGWTERKRRRVRKRDGYECQDCGLTNEEHLDNLGAKLHVHHIEPRRTFESAEKANDMDNLVTLCAHCHMDREAELWANG